MLLSNFVKNKDQSYHPLWMMRQAGRTLPEYRELRKQFPDFLSFCYTPEAVCEATLQPIKRFDYDAAIIFSDILVILQALGHDVSFKAGEGPIIEKKTEQLFESVNFDKQRAFLDTVYKAISLTRSQLDTSKSLIGFAGTPWTLFCYLMEGKGSKEFAEPRSYAYQNPKKTKKIIDILIESISDHLIQQIDHGCDIVQLFDSWGHIVPPCFKQDLLFDSLSKIIKNVKEKHPNTPITYYSQLLEKDLLKLRDIQSLDVVSLYHHVDMKWAIEHLSDQFVLQGNIDPMFLYANDRLMKTEIQKYKTIIENHSVIMNLGHGINKDTPIDRIEQFILYAKG